jgi:hypothetical protein
VTFDVQLDGLTGSLAIDRVKLPSPFEARLSYSAYSALVVIPRHQVRHIQQAELSSFFQWPRGPTPAAN